MRCPGISPRSQHKWERLLRVMMGSEPGSKARPEGCDCRRTKQHRSAFSFQSLDGALKSHLFYQERCLLFAI